MYGRMDGSNLWRSFPLRNYKKRALKIGLYVLRVICKARDPEEVTNAQRAIAFHGFLGQGVQEGLCFFLNSLQPLPRLHRCK